MSSSLRWLSNNPITGECNPDGPGKALDRSPLPRLVPGKGTYKEALTGIGEKAVIVATRISKGVDVRRLRENYEGSLSIHRFHGAQVRHMKYYLSNHLAEERPDVAIIHGGGNDIPCGKNQKVSLLDVANNIIDMGHICRQYGVSRVCISSVLPRDDFYFQFRRTELNDLLRDMCVLNNPTFALSQHIHVDGVHLNKRGSSLLASNYLQFLYNALCPPAA